MTQSEELLEDILQFAQIPPHQHTNDCPRCGWTEKLDQLRARLRALEAVRTATEKWVTKIQTEGTAIEEYNTLTVALAAVKEKEIK